MRRTLLLTTTLVAAAVTASAQSLESGSTDGMAYYLLPAHEGCSAVTPCSVVTYLSYMGESQANTAADVQNDFGGSFAQQNPHTVVIAPMIASPQSTSVNCGGYDAITSPQQAQMVAVVQSVEASMGNTVNRKDSVVTGGSLGGNGTQSALIAYGPKGTVQPGVFSAGLSFDAATYAAAGNAQDIAALCGVPLTAVHGTADTNQSVTYDQDLASVIDSNPACANSFRFVPIQGAGHGTWNAGYSQGDGAGTPLGWLANELTTGGAAPPAATALASSTPVAAASASSPSIPLAQPTSNASVTTHAASGSITPGSGSITDASGHVWSITASGSIQEDGDYTPGGGGTSQLAIGPDDTVYGQDSTGRGWFALSGDGQYWTGSQAPSAGGIHIAAGTSTAPPGLTPSAAPAAPGQCTPTGPGSGAFRTVGGQIIGPDGKPFIARGVNIYDFLASEAAGEMTTTFKGLNYVRVGIHHPYPAPSSFQGFVNEITAQGIVVEFEDHPDGGGGQGSVYTGSQLATELAWYASMAKAYASNPYVWFGTYNEPPTTGGSLSQWQLATYQAIRGTGNNNPILLEVSGWPGAWNNAMDSSVYAQMTNTIWDPHFYGWIPLYSTDQARVDQALADEIAGVQAIKSADGTMPVIVAEYGNSTDGTSVDPNGVQVVNTVVNAGGSGRAGSAAWAWQPGGNADHLRNGDGTLTSPYGEQVMLYINTHIVPLTLCQATQQAQQQLDAITTQIAANDQPAPQSSTPGATTPSAVADPSIATSRQSAEASITQANAVLDAAQQQMQAPPTGSR